MTMLKAMLQLQSCLSQKQGARGVPGTLVLQVAARLAGSPLFGGYLPFYFGEVLYIKYCDDHIPSDSK
jgi:hypothetical protein